MFTTQVQEIFYEKNRLQYLQAILILVSNHSVETDGSACSLTGTT